MQRSSDFDDLLAALEETDNRLRDLYRALADDPSLADGREAELRELHHQRRQLAERTGFALLARRRATVSPHSADVEATGAAEPSAIAPPTEESGTTEADASAGPASAPLSAEVVGEWTRVANAGGIGQVTYEDACSPTWENTLDTLMAEVGAPRELDLELGDELDALDRTSRDPLVGDWGKLPRARKQEWLAMLVARARAVKARAGLSYAHRMRLKAILSRYPPWAAAHQPGHVNGMRVEHEPVRQSWEADGRHFWEALRRHIDGLESPRSVRVPAPPKKPRSTPNEPEEDREDAIEPTWPLWPSVRGRQVVMVGGDPREPNRARLQEVFGFAALEWPEIGGPRKVDALTARIRRRSIDLVIILSGFVDHKQSGPIVAAAKESGVAWALADGYGSRAVRAGLERFLHSPGR